MQCTRYSVEMFTRVQFEDRAVVVGAVDKIVLAPWNVRLAYWLELGFGEVPDRERSAAIHRALGHVHDERVAEQVLRTLFVQDRPGRLVGFELAAYVAERAGFGAWKDVALLELRVPRGYIGAPKPAEKPPEGLLRTEEDHWIAIEVVDAHDRPVPQVELELIVAGGEVRRIFTDTFGRARADRLRATRVVVALPTLDAQSWEAADGGAPHQASRSAGGARWHTAQRGECLSRIAQRYGLRSYRALWDHPKNAPLRKKRKSPHVLVPGDVVAVPGVRIAEIVRTTDAMCRIRLHDEPLVPIRVRLCRPGGHGLAGVGYTVHYDYRGSRVERPSQKTDARGTMRAEVPVSVQTLTVVTQRPPLRMTFDVGALHAVDSDTDVRRDTESVRQRLRALGYDPPDSESTSTLSERIAAFQQVELGHDAPTGELDEQTLSALERAYGA